MTAFRNLKLILKFAISAFLLAAVAIGVVILALRTITALEQNTHEVVDVNATRAVLSAQMGLAVNEAVISEKSIIIETDAAIMAVQEEAFKRSKEQTLTAIDRLIALAGTPERRRFNEEIKTKILAFFSAAERSIALGLKNDAKAASRISSQEVQPARAAAMAAIDERAASNLKDMETAKLHAQELAESSTRTLLGVAVSGLVVAFGLLAATVVFGITKPLNNLVGVLQRMARGEIDAQIAEAVRGDEIGSVGRAVEGIKAMVARKAAEEAEIKRIADATAATERKRAMVELADGFERAVGGVIGMVTSSATELQATAQQMTSTASETAEQSTTVAAAAEQAAANVGTVAAAAEELGASVQEIGRQVSSSADLARLAVDEADQTARLVQNLSQAASKVGEVVSLISSIAGQTNLLALNATIEAARAGEAGRGFAVVASEVKELASQTARATDEISGQIGQIQAATDQAVAAIAGITGRIGEINAVAATIAAAVEEQGAATQEIVRNVSQASTGTSEVTSNITGVARAAEDTGAAASQVLASASELSRQSEHLNAEVGRFLGTVRAA